jgi:hypothetical protein
VSLLDEKSREQDRSLHLLRLDNAALLVRFRAAADQRLRAERKTKQLEAEVVWLRGRMGAATHTNDAAHGTVEQPQATMALHQTPPAQPLYYEESHDAPYYYHDGSANFSSSMSSTNTTVPASAAMAAPSAPPLELSYESKTPGPYPVPVSAAAASPSAGRRNSNPAAAAAAAATRWK